MAKYNTKRTYNKGAKKKTAVATKKAKKVSQTAPVVTECKACPSAECKSCSVWDKIKQFFANLF
jgi:hypothetical protein